MWKGNMVSVLLPNNVSYPISKHVQQKRSHVTLYGIVSCYMVRHVGLVLVFGSILVTTTKDFLTQSTFCIYSIPSVGGFERGTIVTCKTVTTVTSSGFLAFSCCSLRLPAHV